MPSRPIIYAMIPARIGSSRLKMKNLVLINGKPLIYYALQAAKESGVFDSIIINSDHNVFSEIANRYNVGFYRRPKKLGSSNTKSDDVIADFMEKHINADIVCWVNSIAPLQTGDEISNAVDHFFVKKLDSLVTVEEKQVHCMCNNKPINYEQDAPFALTQELIPIKTFVYSIMMWRRKVFLDHYNQKGYALLCGKFSTYPVSKLSGILVNTETDLKIVEGLMRNLRVTQPIKYDLISPNLKKI